MISKTILGIFFSMLFCCQYMYGQTNDKDKDLIFRFPIQLQAGTYSFYEGREYFPKPANVRTKPEAFIPDKYFKEKAGNLKIKNTTASYGAFVLTAKSDYVYLKINGKKGWLKTDIPLPPDHKALLRSQVRADISKRSSETYEKLGVEHEYIRVVPFRNQNFVLVHNQPEDYILDLANRKITWRSGSYYEGASIDFKTDNLVCHGDLGGGSFIFDYHGQRVKQKASEEELAMIDKMIREEFDVDPKSEQAKFLKRYMVAIMNDDGQAVMAIMDSVQRFGLSIMPKRKVKPLTPSQIMSNAILQNNTAQIDSLLKSGFAIDSTIIFQEGKASSIHVPSLSAATEANNISIMKHLIRKGADINKLDHNKKSPICYVKSKEAYKLLISEGASLEKLSYWEPYNRNIYPTEYLYSNKEITDFIIEQASSHLFKDFDFYDRMLYSFIRNNDSTSIKKLLSQGATLNKPDKSGHSISSMQEAQPLYYTETPAMFKFMINNGSRLTNLNHYGVDAHVKTFGWANPELVQWLEKRGLPIQKPNNPYMVFQKDTTFIKYLLDRGVSINSTDSYGNTALIRAKHFEINPVLEDFLLRHGADKNIVNKQGGSYYIGRRRRD